MNQIGIFNKTKETIAELKDVKRVLMVATKMEQIDKAEFNVIIVNDDYIQKLNKEYRHLDCSTDVISFALEDNKNFIRTEERILGDIYISIDHAKKQAIEYNHSLKRELCFLAVHGFLHLLGYDHMQKEAETIMFKRQAEILDACHIER